MKNPFNKGKFNAKTIYGKDSTFLFLILISTSFTIILFLLGLLTLFGITGFLENILSWVDFFVLVVLSCLGRICFYNQLKAKNKKEI